MMGIDEDDSVFSLWTATIEVFILMYVTSEQGKTKAPQEKGGRGRSPRLGTSGRWPLVGFLPSSFLVYPPILQTSSSHPKGKVMG